MAATLVLLLLVGSTAAVPAHRGQEPPAAPQPGNGFDFETRRQHWCWQPLQSCDPPAVSTPGFVRDPLDAFVLQRLEASGLRPSPPAPPEVLLRRLWFDVVGLPPPAPAVRAFVADPSDAAYDRIVDELLASPHFGERWARHWLDLVRYAETLGHEFDFPIPNAWRYRDYVIRALNEDVPYDVFVREHIAGDLLPQPRRDPRTGDDESVQATAAWWFGEQVHAPVDVCQHQADRIDNQIDMFGKAFLGVTIACARCHDHKFDAIRSADYYAMYGFLKSSRYVQAPLQRIAVDGEAYRSVLQAQRALARCIANLAAEEPNADPRWAWFANHEPEAWSSIADAGSSPAAGLVIAAADGDTASWHPVNDAFGAAPWRGPWQDAGADAPLSLRLLPGGWWHSAIAGRQREGTLATRAFVLDGPFVHVRVAGAHSRVQLVLEGLHLLRDPIYGSLNRQLGDGNPIWVTFDVSRWQGRSAFVQCVDQRAHDLADPHREHWPDDGWIAVQQVLLSSDGKPPEAPVAARAALPPLPWPADTLPEPVRAAWYALQAAAAALPVSPTAPALADGTGADERVFARGNHRQRTAPAARRFLEALCGPLPIATGPGSGRLQLADAVLADADPLPARVFANRVWHHLFGRGLVRSVDNFGVLGDRPSHPELLDHLASGFRADGWSIKRLLRRIVRSTTYRQDSQPVAAAADRDPDNVLLHRQNVRRLEAEAIRDALLAVAGRLDPALFGPPVPVPGSEHHDARGRPKRSGPIDGGGRRSIYLAVNRNFLSPMLLAFDLPTPFATIGARNVSNVPAQALTLRNDPFVHAMCRAWAEQLARAPDRDERERLDAVYLAAIARLPDAGERAACRKFLAGSSPDPVIAWTDLVHVLVSTKEFLFRR